MNDKFSTLCKRRASYKGQLTRFASYVSDLGQSLTIQEVTELQLKVNKLENLYNSYDTVQLEIECIDDEEEAQAAEREEFETTYYSLLAKCRIIIDKFQKSSESESGSRSGNHKLVKYPTIDLPKFNGSYNTWLEFHDTFLSLIHSNDEIDDINKFHYLRSSLEGTAKTVIKSVEFSAANYSVAWQLLCDRFDNKRLLIQNHVSALFDIERIHRESAASLKGLLDCVNKNLGSLESLGQPVKHWDTLLIHMITQKLDTTTFREWEKFKGSEKKESVLLSTFLTFIQDRADLLETMELSRNKDVNSATKKSRSQPKTMISMENNQLQSNNSIVSPSSSTQVCPKCSGEHKLNNCSQFLSMSNDDRLLAISSYKICFNCFQSGHFANRCKKPGCKICHRKHNTLIHGNQSASTSTARNLGQGDSSTKPPYQQLTAPAHAEPAPQPRVNSGTTLSVSVSAMQNSEQDEVLLSTALVIVYDKYNREHTVRALLDSGSADAFWDIIGSQKIHLGQGKPILSETKLGWLVSGPIKSGHELESSSPLKCHFLRIPSSTDQVNDDVQIQLSRFWLLEEVSPPSSQYSAEENLCEEHFVKNTTRLKDGRFCVRLPLKQSPDLLGNSLKRATQCFLSLERRFKGNPEFKKLYHDFMLEYQTLGHMSECERIDEAAHFIPHHGVLRESSSTTKLRAVFNASSKTTSGFSLNQLQMVGPVVQDDLLSILIRFRQHTHILAADVEKMYRQISVHPDDRYLQQIIWRNNPLAPLRAFKLNTVTYGTSSAPFLATRCLKQISLDCADPQISEIIAHDFYVDDLLTGGDDLTEVIRIREKVTSELASACMPLRKWKSNTPQLVGPLSSTSTFDLNIGSTEPNKTLGLGWQPTSDELYFHIGTPCLGNTKRDMLSVISQIFDPLGLLAPCVITMKMLLQKLWLYKLSWDEPLPSDLITQWSDIVSSLPTLNHLRVPRHALRDSYHFLDLHIFCDASERAYGACAYLLSGSDDGGEVIVRLLMAKSRVAPLKPTTIPRLELCAALVGARLYEKIHTSLRAQIRRTFFWSDSTIVLGWLKMLPNKLQPFVRNRVATILEATGNCVWRHVPTDENPADHISRGVSASAMQSLSLWWTGPAFLSHDQSEWPPTPGIDAEATLPETKPIVTLSAVVTPDARADLIDFDRFSNLSRLKRAVAYVLRFIKICTGQPTVGYLSENELQNAMNVLIKLHQQQSFPEYTYLMNKQPLPKKSSLLKYNVFLDENCIMRVGGRLENSSFCFEKKHPIILQSTHRLTKLIFEFEHKRLMHAGPQLLLASIREVFWPIGGRNLARSCVHRCVRCNRMKGETVTPMMGNLPEQRLQPGGFPFESVGVDYAGPMSSVSRQGRGSRLLKVYIAIFVCFTTKAIHLELVGDLTSNTFLLALRRFISRRGKPKNIFSDNGTSFVGAYNEIAKFLKDNCNSLSDSMASEGINFQFIPAYAPHFGGLWEAGVKSTKFHLQRVLGNCNLTYEELNTTLVQIEAILNSRPLTPLSSDPEDLLPLTPGHFLIGRPLTSLPAADIQDRSSSHLSRFERIEQLRQHFWSRWSKEYVAELQHRVKWRSSKGLLKLGALVLLKEDGLPPLKWKLGRVVAVHPGSDGIVRVADVRTTSGIVRRAFSKLCPLPDDEESG